MRFMFLSKTPDVRTFLNVFSYLLHQATTVGPSCGSTRHRRKEICQSAALLLVIVLL